MVITVTFRDSHSELTQDYGWSKAERPPDDAVALELQGHCHPSEPLTQHTQFLSRHERRAHQRSGAS